jgi:hypothetical protein
MRHREVACSECSVMCLDRSSVYNILVTKLIYSRRLAEQNGPATLLEVLDQFYNIYTHDFPFQAKFFLQHPRGHDQ